MEIYIEDKNHARVGYIEDNRVEDRGRAVAGYISGDRIENSGHTVVGYITGSRIEDKNRAVAGYINGDRIEDSGRAVAGYVNGFATDSQKAAAGLLLLGLSYGGSGGDFASGVSSVSVPSGSGGYDASRERAEIRQMVSESNARMEQGIALWERQIEARVRQLRERYGADYSHEELRTIAGYENNIDEARKDLHCARDSSEEEVLAELEKYEKTCADEEKRGQRLKKREKFGINFGAALWVGVIIVGIANDGHWFFGIVTAISLIGVITSFACINRRGARGIIAFALTAAAFLTAIGLFAYGIHDGGTTTINVAGVGILAASLVLLLPAFIIGTGTPPMDSIYRQTYVDANALKVSRDRVAKIHVGHAV